MTPAWKLCDSIRAAPCHLAHACCRTASTLASSPGRLSCWPPVSRSRSECGIGRKTPAAPFLISWRSTPFYHRTGSPAVGVGQAFFAMLLSLLVLDYWYVPPFGTLGAYGWSGMLQMLTFASAGIIIALLTHQREVVRVRALVAEREAMLRANQLEATFEAMNDGVVIYNRQGQVLHTNAAIRRLFGLGTIPSKDEANARQELLLHAVQRDEQGQLLPEKRRPLARLFAGEVLTGTQ